MHKQPKRVQQLYLFFAALLLALTFGLNAQGADGFKTFELDDDYQIGTSITDLTGPSAESEMMGYAAIGQRTHGLHMRLWCRTFILVHKPSNTRMVYVAMDLHSAMALRLQVVADLKTYYPELAKLYYMDNIVLSPTHTHSGAGGYSWSTLYSISSLGFDKRYFHSIVSNIVQGIVLAHKNLSDGGSIKINQGLLFNSNINRSPTTYLLNPPDELKLYESVGNTDKTVTVLRFENSKGTELGSLFWYPVHPVSLNNTNLLQSSDNKGYASYAFEKYKNGPDSLPGQGPFIAACSQGNEGDVSCNTMGTSCPDGSPCEPVHSTCGGKVDGCRGKGPGKNDDNMESLKIIGNLQFDAAKRIYENATRKLSGKIQFRHSFVYFTNLTVSAEYTGNGKPGKTCQAALGASFLAGTTDGNGFHFIQGDNTTLNPFWTFVRQFIAKPTQEQIDCQYPKPILLDVGLTKPYPWVPSILPIQMFTIGQDLVILAVPAEMTTMAGRRLRRRIHATLKKYGAATDDTIIVIAGLTNEYCQYCATFEEYNGQRYEGASTLYGPHTHAAYMQEFDKLAVAIATGQAVPEGPMPRNVSDSQINIQPGVVMDTHPLGKPFGTVNQDVDATYDMSKNDTTVTVKFWGAHPKNDYMIGKTFLTVEKEVAPGNWKVVLTDGDYCTRMIWARHGIAESIITIQWQVNKCPNAPTAGKYRIRHFGNSKDLLGKITPYSGVSSTFTLA